MSIVTDHMNRSSTQYHVLLFLCLLCSVACEKQSNPGTALSAGESPLAQSGVAVPDVQSVLDGTDLIDITSLRLRAPDNSIEGEYRSEQGGSQLGLTVSRTGKQWTIWRRYNEPELRERTAVYRTEIRDSVLVSVKNDFFVRVTGDGLLALELNSGLDTIPPSYWIHYRRVRSRPQ